MSKTRELAHNSIIQFAGKAISTALGLVAIGMMTRYLGQEQFGWYTTTISFLQFVGIMIDFGMTPVTSQMLSSTEDNDKKQKKLLKNLLGFRFFTAAFFLALAPIVAWFIPVYPTEVKIAISFTTIHFLAVLLRQVLTGLYQTKLKMHIHVAGELLGRLILVAGLWLFIYINSSFLPIMGAVVAGSVSYALLLFVYAAKKYNAGFEFDLRIWKKIFKKAWPLAISIMFNVVYLKGDTVLLSLFRTQSEVGIYGAAYKVIDVLAESAMMLMGLLLPLLSYAWAKNLKDKFKNRLQKSFDIMMAVALPAIAGLIMLSEKIIVLIAGNQFSTSAQILEILALALLGVFLGAIFGHTAVAINKQKKTLWVYISGAILTLIGYLIFLPKYGMFGAAWMSVFSEMYVGLLLFVTIKYYTKKTFAFKTLFKIIFSTIAMIAVLYLLPNWHVLLLTAIGGIVYFIILTATGGLSVATIKEITKLKRKEEV